MYPSKEKGYAGIFVKNQIEYLEKKYNNIVIDKLVMERSFTKGFKTVIKYLLFSRDFFSKLLKRYDVIHLHFYVPLIFLLRIYKLFHPNVKLLCTFHGRDITVQVDNKFLKGIYYQCSKKLDVAIAVGSEIERQVKEKLSPKKIIVLSAGVDDTVFYRTAQAEKKYDFIFVGSLIYRKGVDLLIEAIRILPDDVKICFIGTGEYLEKIQALIKSGKSIELYEGLSQQQIRDKLNQSKFFVFPSRNEGYPLSTIEALFCGVPVIGSDIPQVTEQIIEGKNGWITTLNPSDISACMLKALSIVENDYNKLVITAIHAKRDDSLSYVCSKLAQLYQA